MKSYNLHKLNNDNKGYSFLFVIFGVIFVAAIGVIAVTMARNYYVTTIVDEKSTQQFYTTEGVVQEVRTGLNELVNTAAEEAYKEIMEDYAASGSQTRNEKYSISFLSKLMDKLTGTGAVWDGTDNAKVYVCDIDTIKKLTTRPDSVSVAPGSGSITVVLYNETSTEKEYHMLLKNIYVNYTDDNGYNSKIRTDIMVKVPNYHLEGNTTINELKNYIVITDDQLNISNSGEHNVDMAAAMIGNIYAGAKDDSILINNDQGGSQATFNSDRIIARGDLNIKNGGDVNIVNKDGTSTADLWLMNFRLSKNIANSSKHTEVTSRTNAFVENDFVIDDPNSIVNLSGSYYGYSFNKENTASTAATELKSFYSSAMLINGRNTTLNTSGLYKLVLAGRAFIEKKNNDSTNSPITSDIQTGEALSVKSNQLAYLVPDKYMSNGENPAIEGRSDSVDTTALLASDIGSYLDNSDPVAENHLQGQEITYYFLKFKDENSANEYFKKFYDDSDNQVELERSARSYITAIGDTGLKLDASLFLLAGNIVNSFKLDGTSAIKEANYFSNSGTPKTSLLEDGIRRGKEYVGRQLTLLAGSATTMRLADPTSDPLISTKIIDYSQFITDIKKDYSSLGASVFFTQGNTTVSSCGVNKGLIVSGGDVEVNESFEGLIIAKGKVTVTGKVTAQSNIVLIRNLLKEIVKDPDVQKIFYEYKTFDSNAVDKVKISDYVTYKNWSKNDAD